MVKRCLLVLVICCYSTDGQASTPQYPIKKNKQGTKKLHWPCEFRLASGHGWQWEPRVELAVRNGSREKTNNSLKKFVSKWHLGAHHIKSACLHWECFLAYTPGVHFSHFLNLQSPYLSPARVTKQVLLFLIRYMVRRPEVYSASSLYT